MIVNQAKQLWRMLPEQVPQLQIGNFTYTYVKCKSVSWGFRYWTYNFIDLLIMLCISYITYNIFSIVYTSFSYA